MKMNPPPPGPVLFNGIENVHFFGEEQMFAYQRSERVLRNLRVSFADQVLPLTRHHVHVVHEIGAMLSHPAELTGDAAWRFVCLAEAFLLRSPGFVCAASDGSNSILYSALRSERGFAIRFATSFKSEGLLPLDAAVRTLAFAMHSPVLRESYAADGYAADSIYHNIIRATAAVSLEART